MSPHEHRIVLMAVNPRAANVGTVAHPVTLPTRSLALGQERAAQFVLATVTLLAWAIGFGDTPTGMLAALASTAVAWTVGSSMLRDRGEYHRALAVRLVRHAQAATLVTALVVATAALLDTGAEPLPLRAPPCPPGPGRGASPARRRLPVRLPRGRRVGRAPASHADDREPAAGARPGRGRRGHEARRRFRGPQRPRRRAGRLRRQPLARGRPGAGRARRTRRGC